MKRLILVALAITGILAAGCIVRYGSLYTDNNDTSHFVGLASNLSKVDVISASVKVDFYDASNHLLDSKVVNPCTRTLQIGNNSPFEAVPNDGVVADHVQTTVQWLTLGHKTAADVDVNTDNIAVSTDSGETHITGMVDANEDLKSVNVCAALLNSSGAVVKVGEDSVGTINDTDSGPFDIGMTSDDTATQFELWTDGLRVTDPTAPVVVGPLAISQFSTDTGTLSPSDDEKGTGGTFNSPDNAFADDGVFATVTTTSAAEIYEAYGAKAAVPSGDTIVGIAVPVDLKVNTTDHDPTVEVELSYDGGTTWLALSTPTKDITSTDEKTYTFGNSTEDWGHTWTRTQLDDDHFRVKVTFTATTTSTKFSLDWIPVIIYFTTS